MRRWFEVATLLAVVVAVALLVPWWMHRDDERWLVGCDANEKRIGTALEMYSTDNSGRYPRRMQDLLPNYLSEIPTCPAARRGTYSASYVCRSNPDRYTFCCQGRNHPRRGADYPAFYSPWCTLSGH